MTQCESDPPAESLARQIRRALGAFNNDETPVVSLVKRLADGDLEDCVVAHEIRLRAAIAVLPAVYAQAVANGVDSAEAVAAEAVELADALIAALEAQP